MKESTVLTISSLLTVILMTAHIAGDIVFKMSTAGLPNLFAVFVFVVLLYGTLVLSGRRAGHVIILLGSLLGQFMVVLHMKGTHGLLGGDIGSSSDAFFSVWTLLALAVTSTFSLVLSVRALSISPQAAARDESSRSAPRGSR